MTARELAERVMAERDLEISDSALRNSVVFKVVQALRHARRRKLVRMVEKRKGMCVWAAGDAVTARASLPLSLPRPADRHGKRPADQAICQTSVAFVPVILEPGGVGCAGIEIPPFNPQVLAADHPSQPREVALGTIGVSTIQTVSL